MNKLWVPYEIALKLKEKGFKDLCIYHYKRSQDFTKHSNVPTFEMKSAIGGQNHNQLSSRVSAPLYQQVLDWFRERHEIYILPFIQFENKGIYDPDLEESLDNIYFIFNLKELRKNNQNILPYIELINPTFERSNSDWYGCLNMAIEEAITLI